jgi:hypothetical protein
VLATAGVGSAVGCAAKVGTPMASLRIRTQLLYRLPLAVFDSKEGEFLDLKDYFKAEELRLDLSILPANYIVSPDEFPRLASQSEPID